MMSFAAQIASLTSSGAREGAAARPFFWIFAREPVTVGWSSAGAAVPVAGALSACLLAAVSSYRSAGVLTIRDPSDASGRVRRLTARAVTP